MPATLENLPAPQASADVAHLAPEPLSDTLVEALAHAQRLTALATSPNTERALASDWRDFQRWCDANRLRAHPAHPSTVALYLAARARDGLKISTLRRRLATINAIHHRRDPEDPYSPASFQHAAVGKLMRGLRRELGVRPVQKAALSTAQLRVMVEALPDTLLGLRDKALLLLGFAGGVRRSALAALDFSDIRVEEDGLRILIRRDKTDQDGKGHEVGIPFGSDPRTCPVRAYRKWIAAANISSGPVFRAFRNQTMMPDGITAQVVARVVKHRAARAGLDPVAFAGHSLRAGHVTQAARSGAAERDIMRQTGHRSVEMVRRYIRAAGLFIDNSAAKLGL